MATINYWDDDWEEQLAATEVADQPKESKETKIETTTVESWEELSDDDEHTEAQQIQPPVVQPVVKSVWKTPKAEQVDREYREEYPSLKPNVKANIDYEERARVARLKEKSKINIFEAFNDDEAGSPSKPRKVSRPQPIKEPRKEPPRDQKQERRRAPRKSRFCRDGASCTRGERCWWAHSERELVPERCHRGRECRCITVDYSKEVHNNPRSRRVCMYRHDENIQSYLKRTGQTPHAITVAPHLSTQAREMARVAGGRVKVNVR